MRLRPVLPAVLATAALAGCGADDEQPAGRPPPTRIAVEVTGAASRPVRMEVTCGGERTCSAKQLAALRAALRSARDRKRACTELYGGPERAHVTGTLDGRPVDVTVNRANGCGIADYDALFAALGRTPPIAP